MKNSKMFFVFSFLLAVMFMFQMSPSTAGAQSSTAQAMTNFVSEMRTQLNLGSRGDSVVILQAFLSADASVYPEGIITGYYGSLTKAAVQRFQKKYGISSVGRVGPMTLAKINEKINDNPIATFVDTEGNLKVCAIVPPGHLIAPGFLRKMNGVTPIVPDCQTLPPGIAMKLGVNSSASLVISGVSIVGVSSTSAVINWNTNKPSGSQVMYGVTSSYGQQTSYDNNLVTHHQQTLAGLSASTVYHYQVKSTDALGNVSVSADYTFTTSATNSDVTAPVISNVSATLLTSGSATIIWTTNEPATSRVSFGLNSSYDMQTSLDTNLVTVHQQLITGLSANTTYHYQVRSIDASGNSSTSVDYAFTTSL